MSKDDYRCRACGCESHEMILDLGNVPLANAFVATDAGTEDTTHFPLSLVMCSDCRLLQIHDEVPREDLFSNYLWVTSTSAGAQKHAEWLSAQLWEKLGAKSDKAPFLVEIASNDGFFLKHFRDMGFEILGVDPSNLAEEANEKGLTSIRDFFGDAVASNIVETHGQADLIVARNVLGHSSALQDLVAGMSTLLAPQGTLILEMPYAYLIRERTQYDYIFHEHLSYLTVGSTHNLLARFGLKITDIQFVDMNGGSLLCEVHHQSDPTPANDQTMLAFEDFIGLNEPQGWHRFASDVKRQREQLVAMLQTLKAEGKRIVAYGAAARFMTVLNYCGIDTELIDAVGDANPRKQGLLCPGVRIPVVSPAELMASKPDYVLIGAWNFKDEIVKSLRTDFAYDREFIMPLPQPEIFG